MDKQKLRESWEYEIQKILLSSFDNNKYKWSKAHKELKELIYTELTQAVAEARRGEQRKIVHGIYSLDWIQILSKAVHARPTSWNDDPVREWRNASDEVLGALVTELKEQGIVADELKETAEQLKEKEAREDE